MSHEAERSERTVSTRTMEVAVAGALMGCAVLIMWDNWRVGASWGDDGPGPGYFPFRIGVILFAVSAATFATKLRSSTEASLPFVERSRLRLVLQVLIPTVVFVILVPFLGIYVAAALFISYFMYRLGGYSAGVIVPVAVLVPAVLFVLFEVWFLVPLPKGPIEEFFGY